MNKEFEEALNKLGETLDILQKYSHEKGIKFVDGYKISLNLKDINNALIKAQEQEKVLNELLMLINDLEPTFNRKGMVSMNDDNLGTFIKNYFIDNASDLLKKVLKSVKN